MHPETDHTPVFMICRSCDAVAEAVVADVGEAIRGAATAARFVVERMNIEVLGLCPRCAK